MTEDEKQALCQRKNDWYVEYIKKLEKSELLPGVENFLKQAHADVYKRQPWNRMMIPCRKS